MSSSTAIPVSPELEQTFRRGGIRFIIVHIVNEVLVATYSHPEGGSLASDWAQIAPHAGNNACYVLVKVAAGKWVTVTYVPDLTKVKDKMVYAATKATLLNKLGYQHFGDDVHATNRDELSYDFYQGTLKRVNARSESEELIDVVHREENEERNFRMDREVQRGIGGYHSVSMPLDSGASDKVRGIVNGTFSLVELAVNPAKNGIICTNTSNVSGNFASQINANEPRYYLIKHQSKNLFVYCCPNKAPQQLRMVYSTAKGSVLSEIKSLGFHAGKPGETSEGSELNDHYFRDLAASPISSPIGPTRSRMTSSDGQVKAARQSIVESAHPVYSLMGSGNRAKKVVLPPPGAY